MENNITVEKINPEASAVESALSVSVADQPRSSAVVHAWQDFINEFADWKSFLTLTVDNDHWCSRDGMEKRWRSLVQILNRDLYGNHYVRMVGHCYFPYVGGFEYTKNNVIHMHVVVGSPVNYPLIHRVWNHMSGFAWLKPVTDNKGVSNYICKYVVKQQDLIFWKPKLLLPSPAFRPLWYLENLPDGHPHLKTLNRPKKK
jgi:hypothetical protein